jgi:hypothetical protein
MIQRRAAVVASDPRVQTAAQRLAHNTMGDLHFLRSVREIQVPGSRFEEARRLERRKRARHAE